VIASLLVAVAVVAGAQASNSVLLDPNDATELAAVLADATETQDVCYGWRVTLSDQSSSGPDGTTSGSNAGVGESPITCSRWILFTAYITYTSEASEAQDSATFGIESNLPDAPDRGDLEDVGVSERALLSDRDDLTIINAVSALPLLAAERGIAPPVELEPNTAELPASDRPTGTPGSDWLRQNWTALGVAAVLLLLGIAMGALAVLRPTWVTDIKEATANVD
jgi:hypothetical protein